MQEQRIPRTGLKDLVFNGEILAEQTSRKDGEQPIHWTEIKVLRIGSHEDSSHASNKHDGKMVVSIVGKTALPNETNRGSVIFCSSPEEVVEALYNRKFLTGLSKRVLGELVLNLPELFKEISVERL